MTVHSHYFLSNHPSNNILNIEKDNETSLIAFIGHFADREAMMRYNNVSDASQ